MPSFHESADHALGSELLTLVLRLGAFGKERGVRCFLIGGGVRDVLLGKRTTDVDILVEGNAIELARELHREWSAVVPEHQAPERADCYPRYGTAKLVFGTAILPGLARLDFASAREERYPIPAGAPEVKYPVTIDRDLCRRDFTINAMAVEIGDTAMPVIDPFSGRDDLQRGTIRILHGQSFVDDPARLIRGLRFSTRFGFSFDEDTEKAFRRGIDDRAISRLPFQRRFDELRKAFGEPAIEPLLERMEENGFLRELHAEVRFGTTERERIRALPSSGGESDQGIAVCAILIAPLDPKVRGEILQAAALPKKLRQTIQERAERS